MSHIRKYNWGVSLDERQRSQTGTWLAWVRPISCKDNLWRSCRGAVRHNSTVSWCRTMEWGERVCATFLNGLALAAAAYGWTYAFEKVNIFFISAVVRWRESKQCVPAVPVITRFTSRPLYLRYMKMQRNIASSIKGFTSYMHLS